MKILSALLEKMFVQGSSTDASEDESGDAEKGWEGEGEAGPLGVGGFAVDVERAVWDEIE